MYLHESKTDEWGQSVIVFDADFREKELSMLNILLD